MNGTVFEGEVLKMGDNDNVATAISDLDAGTRIQYDGGIELKEDIPFGHKVSLVALDPGDPLKKYGEQIGQATQSVAPGEWVHTHNVESRRGRGDVTAGE